MKKYGLFKGNSKGIGLVEVLIGFALLGLLVATTSSMFSQSFKAVKHTGNQSDTIDQIAIIRMLLNVPESCTSNFIGQTLNRSLSATQDQPPGAYTLRTRNADGSAGPVVAQEKMQLSPTLTFQSLRLRITNWGSLTASGYLDVAISQTGGLGNPTKDTHIPVSFALDSSNKIVRCLSDAPTLPSTPPSNPCAKYNLTPSPENPKVMYATCADWQLVPAGDPMYNYNYNTVVKKYGRAWYRSIVQCPPGSSVTHGGTVAIGASYTRLMMQEHTDGVSQDQWTSQYFPDQNRWECLVDGGTLPSTSLCEAACISQ